MLPGLTGQHPRSGPLSPPWSGQQAFLQVVQVFRDEGTESRAQGNAGEALFQQGPSSAPAIFLPKRGGALHGIGGKLADAPVTGTVSMNVPIATSPGRAGFGPQLNLSYDSGAGNGPFGLAGAFAAERSFVDQARPRAAPLCASSSFCRHEISVQPIFCRRRKRTGAKHVIWLTLLPGPCDN